MNIKDYIDWSRIKFFRRGEFACRCCGKIVLSDELVLKLDLARELAETPFVITSGYRCPSHNEAVGGVKTSAHMSGLAADIACPDSVMRLNILRGLIVAGFRRIGIGKDFIHCDIDTSKANKVWLYKDR
ncbi:MAG: peptidase M15 [Candidatus Cloacimonetes bacterium]|nr:peptidase M15 [Candidatus Cloacimonadota bacterium]